jgi:hypothetical protein
MSWLTVRRGWLRFLSLVELIFRAWYDLLEVSRWQGLQRLYLPRWYQSSAPHLLHFTITPLTDNLTAYY